MFLVYDFTNKKYYAKQTSSSFCWTFFRTEGFRFETCEAAEEQAQFWRGVNANDYRVISY